MNSEGVLHICAQAVIRGLTAQLLARVGAAIAGGQKVYERAMKQAARTGRT